MFWHNFKYSLKVLGKNRILIFWTFAFPIILGIFFHMAFSNIENSEKLDIIKIAMIDNESFQENEITKQAIETLSDQTNEDRIFDTQYVTIEKAKEMLQNNEITGYVLCDKEDMHITVNANGIQDRKSVV